jgi:hypothetical protein
MLATVPCKILLLLRLLYKSVKIIKIILPVLRGYENWSLTLKEDYRLMVFEKNWEVF